MSDLPPWVSDAALAPLWRRVRDRFEATGLQSRGRVEVTFADREERHAASALLGRTITRDSVQIDLAGLDVRLRERSGVGGLEAVLTRLGAAPSNRPAARAARAEARERPLALARELVDRAWASDWIADVRRVGLLAGRAEAESIVTDAATVLNAVTGDLEPAARSRVELAAHLLGDAHALDRDRLVHQVVLRGLAVASGVSFPDGAREREQLWQRYGVEPDLLSRTCLVWNLRPSGDEPVQRRMRIAADAGDPVHLTEWDLRRIGVLNARAGERVLVCENPRVIEALAEAGRAAGAAVCTSGEPNLVVDGVLARLRSSGADLRYHGDFDWPGIAIANRIVARFGARPWWMNADHYLSAVRSGAALAGAPIEPSWDAELGAAMRLQGRAIHEESLLPELVDAWRRAE